MDVPFDLWGQRGRPGVDVVGESHYADAIRDEFGSMFQPGGCELLTTAQLVPEPWNRHDPSAVAVWVGERQVGYLPRHDAGRYAPVLARLVAEGWLPQVAARLWAASDYRGRPGLTGSVQIDLAEPHLIAPVNRPPDRPYRLLPPGISMPVTGEQDHLRSLPGPEGECWAHVTLHELVEPLPRGSRSVLEVRLDGAPIGRLTPRLSAELLPAVRRLAANHQLTAARAVIKGANPEVFLYAPRAHELPDSWLSTVSPGASIPPPAVAPLQPAGPVIGRGSAGVPNPPGHWDRIDARNSTAVPGPRPPVFNLAIPVNAGPVDTLPGTAPRVGPHPGTAAPARVGTAVPEAVWTPAPEEARPVAAPARVAGRVSVPERSTPPRSPVAARPGPIPPRPAGVRFAVPPGWPQPPAGWTPPAGWHPDPSWPPAPPDWPWWVPYWE